MSHYTFEVKPDAPIMVITPDPARIVEAIEGGMPDILQVLDDSSKPMHVILDLHDVSMNLDDLMRASSLSARGQSPIMHHPHLRETIFITTNSFMKLGIKGLSSATFGRAKIAQFDTVTDALAYCYNSLGKGFEASGDRGEKAG